MAMIDGKNGAKYSWCLFNRKEDGSNNIILKMGIVQDTWDC